MEYASKGLAGTALGFGIGGAAMSLANGGLGNLLGGIGQNNKPAAADVVAAVTPAIGQGNWSRDRACAYHGWRQGADAQAA